MEGDDAVRFCGKCRKNVYNVAQLSRAEAIALIQRAEGRVCVQLTRRADGTIATGDCWAQLRRARKRGLFALAAAAPAILIAQLWSQAFGLRALGALFHRPHPALSVPATTLGEPPIPDRPAPRARTVRDLDDDTIGGEAGIDDSEVSVGIGAFPPVEPKEKSKQSRR
jgi:hypothetical protein